MDGLLVVDKPAGPTSHEVVARVRRALGERRIGHTGTLDPAATGVLALVLGRATRLARFLSASDKSYDAVIRLGVATDTNDAQGTPAAPPHQGPLPSRDVIDRALDEFRGTFLQQPPAYSAKKIDGRRSYRLAREDRHTTPARLPRRGPRHSPRRFPDPVTVTTHQIELVSVNRDMVTLRVACSAGFYVRALAHDLGARLRVGAHLLNLRRTRAGDVTLDQALELDAIERDPAGAVRTGRNGVRDSGFGIRGVRRRVRIPNPKSRIPRVRQAGRSGGRTGGDRLTGGRVRAFAPRRCSDVTC